MKQPSYGRFKNNQNESDGRVQDLLSRQKRERHLRKLRRKRIFMGVAATLLFLLLFFFSPLLHIQTVELSGFTHADQKAVAKAAGDEIGRHVLLVRKNALKTAALSDPIIQEVSVATAWRGKLQIKAKEYPLDFALPHEGAVYLLNRNGRVLKKQELMPKDVLELLDDTMPLAPGNTMYGAGEKKELLNAYAQLMDQNTSPIRFQRLDIKDLSAITLDYKGWTVELGEAKTLLEMQEDGTLRLRKKLNQAINTLNSIMQDFEPGYIDLRYDVEPAYRPKGE